MATWTTFSNNGLETEVEDHTFDLSMLKKNNNMGEAFCVRCKTMAKMSPSKSTSILTDYNGMCMTQGCPGFSGSASEQILNLGQLNSEKELRFDDSSDDTPLLSEAGSHARSHKGGSPGSSLGEEFGAMEHCHTSVPRRQHASAAKRKLLIASGLCLLFIVGEVTGGYLSGSLAIMSDAAHMFSDFASFLVSLFAIHLGSKKSTKKFTYGLYRAEVLGAFMTVMIIWFVTGVLLYLACLRLVSGEFEVEPNPMIVVASCAVVFNIVLGLLLRGVPHSHGHSHGGGHNHSHMVEEAEEDQVGFSKTQEKHEHINLRAAMIHVLGDLIQSIGVLISSVIIKVWPEYKKADPVCTLLFSIIVFCTTVTILRDTVLILLESKPRRKDYDAIFNDLFNLDHVIKVHDLHIWSLTTDQEILTVHLAVDASVKTEKILQNALRLLRTKYNITRSTIQVEDYKASVMNDCEQCQFIKN